MALLVIVWLIAMCYAFWWFLVRDIRSFYPPGQEQFVHFENAQLGHYLNTYLHSNQIITESSSQKSVLIHFWDPSCLCSRFNTQHVQQLIETFGPQGVRFIVILNDTIPSPEEFVQQASTLFPGATLIRASQLALPSQVPASPATAILDQHGQLSYFGPYTLGALCLPSGDGLVETVLKSLLAGRQAVPGSIAGSGCFCAWPTKD